MSTIEFKLPKLGDDVEKGTVVKLLVAEGEQVAAEQPLLEVEIDKATVELPAPAAGKVERLAVGEGDVIKVGQLVLVLSTNGAGAGAGAAPAAKPEPAKPEPAKPEPAKAAAPTKRSEPEPGRGETLPAGPAVRRLARLLKVDLARIQGTGQRGRITVDDVHAYLERLGQQQGGAGRAPLPPLPDFAKWGPVDVQKVSAFRARTAEAMSRSWESIPHVTNFDEADTTELEAGRRAFREGNPKGPKVTMTVLVAKAVAAALRAHPELNSSIDFTSGQQHFKRYVHLGIAVDTDYGLLVPVLRDVDKKSALQLSDELDDLAKRTREKKVQPEELKGATFTISNLGGIGGTGFTPIINWPQVAILGVSRGSPRYQPGPDGQPVPRTLTPLSLSYDHRVIDGALAARFLRRVCELLSSPTRLMLEV
ncbi:MAG: dihydrolipoamide acetyltransferase family protein [Planctomycetota bacterium]